MFKQKPKKISLNKVCRTCLNERRHLRDIIETKIPNMIEYCASVQVKEDDELPKQICISCYRQIAKYYTFKRIIERNDKILRDYIKHISSKVKHKDVDILCKAVNNAEIKEPLDTFEISDEDVPLSDRKRKSEEIAKPILFDDSSASSQSEMETVSRNIIYTDGPPPLIPLQGLSKPESASLNISNIKLLPNTPVLIPIKPLVRNQIDKLVAEDLKLECTICGEEFYSVSALKDHRSSECQISGLQCTICKKEFNERKKLIGHLRGHMVAKDYGCKICGKCYPNPSTFKVHMRTHTGERPFKCQICNKGFVRWAGVVGHMKTHNSIKPYKCDTCGKSFKISSNLERHKILHSGSFPFCCNFCGKTFSQADNLQLHIRTYHTFEKPFLCNECGKGFVSSTRLNRHMWVHSGHKPYRCKQCSKAYSNSNDLKNHIMMHSGGPTDADKPHVCIICNMRFFHACRLAQHMKIHEKKHCSQCNSSFMSRNLLNQHIETKHLKQTKKKHEETKESFVHDPHEIIQEEIIHQDNTYIKF